MKNFVLCLGLLLMPSAGLAQDMKSMKAATDLGNLLAYEKPCSLTYDQAAIEAWIDANTDPSDMGFSSTLSMMTGGAAFEIEGQGESERSAHCHAVERSAKHFGFLK